MKYQRILQFVSETPWAITPGKLAVIRDLLTFRAVGGELTADEVRARIGARQPQAAGDGLEVHAAARTRKEQPKGVAVIPIYGTIIPRANLLIESSGAISTERLSRQLRRAVNDPGVGAIVLDIDSPGGNVMGVPELAGEIYAIRGTKPITAVANHMAASGAYWLGSQADELAITPSGLVGSIGVLTMHHDISVALENDGIAVNLIHAGKYKIEGNPYEPLTDEARADIQARVDEYYGMFTAAVAQGRGVAVTDVQNGFGEGRVVGAETAVSLGMADRVATLDEVIGGLLSNMEQSDQARAGIDYRKRRLRATARN